MFPMHAAERLVALAHTAPETTRVEPTDVEPPLRTRRLRPLWRRTPQPRTGAQRPTAPRYA